MNLLMWLYLVDVAGSLKGYFCLGLISGAIIILSTLVVSFDNYREDDRYWKSWRKWLYGGASVFIFSTFMYLALPTNETLYLMLGAKTAEDVVASPAMQKIGTRVMTIIDKKLNELSGEEPKAPKKDTK